MEVSAEEIFQHAIAALQKGAANEAELLFKQVLQTQPGHVGALNLCSMLLVSLGRFEEAEHYVRLALKVNATSDATFSNYGVILKALQRPAEALERFSQALEINASVAETWNNRGLVFDELKRYREAISDFDHAIAINSNYPDAVANRGNAMAKIGLFEQAIAAYDRALALRPELAKAWLGRGNVCTELRQDDNALAAYDRALALNPGLAEAWLGRGNVCAGREHYDDAVAAYDRALALKPDLAEAWLGSGNVCSKLKQYDNAFTAYDAALTLKPDQAEAWLGRGNVFYELKQYDNAFAAYDKTLTFKPDAAGAWLGRGNVLADLKQHDRALAAYDGALDLDPAMAEAWLGRGNVFTELMQYDDAFAAYDRALAIKPNLKYAAGDRLHAKLQMANWTQLESEFASLVSAVKERQSASRPFPFLGIPSSPADQLQCAKCFIANEPVFPAMWRGENYSHDRVRIGYLSADFHDHATAHLIAGLFEHHDRSRFEITAFSFGLDQDSDMRRRLKSAVEHFADVQQKNDQEIAELVRRAEIDIAIDLKGYTQDERHNVLARRAAPIQVNYLGYPGTMGADHIDYILADPTIIPKDHFRFYSEQVVWLPESYQVNDRQRRIAEPGPTRRECALPDKAFVFCCFNNTYKITPDVFEIWMRLLRANETSVLWLIEANSAAVGNLRQQAEARGVSSDRLIFAPKMPLAKHLSRHRQADLVLDTLPYNAHTTASDALWAGVPVLTCLGSTFAGRVAGSLLKAVGLDDLVTSSLTDYEALALRLARDPSYLASIKSRLAHNRTNFPLFDTERFTRHIEAAYTTMWKRHQSGETPRAFAVEKIR